MFDDIDLKILSILQEKARIPNAEVARQVGMAPSAVLERVRKLEQQNLVEGYEVRLNPRQLGLPLAAFVLIECDPRGEDPGPALAALPTVQEVHQIAGDDGYLIKLRFADHTQLNQLLTQEITALPGVRRTRTQLVLNTIKQTLKLPLETLAQPR